MQKIKNFIKDQRVKNKDIMRLICLYSLRYERSNNSELSILRDMLLKRGNLQDTEREVWGPNETI